jgi:hypothetical protein
MGFQTLGIAQVSGLDGFFSGIRFAMTLKEKAVQFQQQTVQTFSAMSSLALPHFSFCVSIFKDLFSVSLFLISFLLALVGSKRSYLWNIGHWIGQPSTSQFVPHSCCDGTFIV